MHLTQNKLDYQSDIYHRQVNKKRYMNSITLILRQYEFNHSIRILTTLSYVTLHRLGSIQHPES
jgi:hypothetical protein